MALRVARMPPFPSMVQQRVNAREMETNDDAFTAESDSVSNVLQVLANDEIKPASAATGRSRTSAQRLLAAWSRSAARIFCIRRNPDSWAWKNSTTPFPMASAGQVRPASASKSAIFRFATMLSAPSLAARTMN
jgi:hypothetical protein